MNTQNLEFELINTEEEMLERGYQMCSHCREWYDAVNLNLQGHCDDCQCEVDEDEDEPNICKDCNGSGEGMYDGTRCGFCGGSGESTN